MKKEKLIEELDRLMKECEAKQKSCAEFTDKWYRAGGQLSVVNNLLHKVKSGCFE